MCRNIKTLYNFDPPATEDEVHAAATQYVRKISGFSKPSRAKRRHSTRRSMPSRRRHRGCSTS